MEQYFEIIKDSALFTGMTENEIYRILGCTEYELVSYEKNEIVSIHSGKTIFVIGGELYSAENNKDGTKCLINLFTPKINIMIPLSTVQGFTSIDIIARKKSLVLYLPTESFTKVMPSVLILQNVVQQNIIKIYNDITRNNLERGMMTAEKSARKRILKYIELASQKYKTNVIKMQFSRKDLADLMRIDISTLMRELKLLKNEGIIDYDRKTITVINNNQP